MLHRTIVGLPNLFLQNPRRAFVRLVTQGFPKGNSAKEWVDLDASHTDRPRGSLGGCNHLAAESLAAQRVRYLQ